MAFRRNYRSFGSLTKDVASDSDSSSSEDAVLNDEAWAFVNQHSQMQYAEASTPGPPASPASSFDGNIAHSSPIPDAMEDVGSNEVSETDSDSETESVGSVDSGVWTEERAAEFSSNVGLAPLTQQGSTPWKGQRTDWMESYAIVIPMLIVAVACWETLDVTGARRCAVDSCAAAPLYKCYSCASISLKSTHYCKSHATIHRTHNHCHRIQDQWDSFPPLPTTSFGNEKFKQIRCCSAARGKGRRALLHSLTGTERVQLVYCADHQNGNEMCVVLLRDHGFFASRVQNTDHAFSHQVVSLSLKFRALGVAFQTLCEVFFGTDLKDGKTSGLYQPFMDAVRQFAVVKYHTPWNLFTGTFGGIRHWSDTNKKSEERGGSGSHGSFELTNSYFKEPIVRDVVADAKEAKRRTPKLGCEAQHKAGAAGVGLPTGNDVDMIVHVDCAAHAIVQRVYDVKGGERLMYADDVVAWGMDSFKKRGLVLGYDVACKELNHLDFYGLLRSIIDTILFILFIPAMHVYAHGKDCQSLFSPRFLMGLGLTMDGEGHERVNSWLARMIGLTQRETHENRRLDIVLFLEFYNWSKVRKLVAWTVKKLMAVFAGLAEVKAALGLQWRRLETTSYSVVVESVTGLRQRLVDRASKEPPSTKDDLRLQIDHLARSIVLMDKHLRGAPGTKMGNRLKKAMTSTFTDLYKKLDEFNGLCTPSCF
ncbi:hypothetical protein HDU79_004872 [Rhizoclosmatium sp. JEL0117]|nr:hypothetical protein HDU79_004872 [Rhizoclosmatium sp. JEL0117]